MAYLAPLIPYLTAASAVVGAGSAISSADEARRQAHFQQDTAIEEAKQAVILGNIAATNAGQLEQDAQEGYEANQLQRRRILGQTISATASSGLTLSGSSMDVYHDTALTVTRQINQEYLSTLTDAGNARAGSAAAMTSSRNMLITANEYGRSAKAATTNGYLSAAGKLMGGLSSAANVSQQRDLYTNPKYR